MRRVFILVPLPHVFEHLPHDDQAECLQFTGQFCLLQTRCPDEAGHLRPPFLGCVTTRRVLVWVPPPHFLLHAVQAFHELILQWTGQPLVRHDRDLARDGQPLPPYFGLVVILRVVFCVPPPQVFEHAGQPFHDDTAQSIGQCFELQTLVCLRLGHLTPPYLAETWMPLERVVLPPPHVLLHDAQDPHDETLQLTGQGEVLQALVSLILGQALPPCACGTLMTRLRVCEPVPHFLEQDPHFCHDPTTQFTAQDLVLHAFDCSFFALHALPPWRARDRERCRNLLPPPHALLQEPHLLHAPTPQFCGVCFAAK